MKSFNYYVYIITNWKNSVIYIGVTGNLEKRMFQHINKEIEGFSSKYNLNKLVYYEHYNFVHDALNREKNLKKWNRSWKFQLIEKFNPNFNNLFNSKTSEIDFMDSG